MKYLTIIRHAKSSRENPELDDIVRPLNERGESAVKIVGHFLNEQQIRSDLIISSPATRALETARGICKIIQYDTNRIQTEPVVYFGTSSAIISMLQDLNNSCTDVFLFGHEPILSSLIFQLTKNHLEKFSTCSVYRISLEIKTWKEIGSKKGKCEFFVNPKLLMEK